MKKQCAKNAHTVEAGNAYDSFRAFGESVIEERPSLPNFMKTKWIS